MKPVKSRFIILSFLVVAMSGCAEYKAGECAQNPNDGYIYRITAVNSGKYTVQGWVDNKWGIPTETPMDFLRDRYVKVTCPFSTEVIKEKK